VTETMIAYGEKVGVAFQLADDVLDLSSDPSQSGKTPGTDLREAVPTLPVLLVRRAAAQGDVKAAELVELLDGDLSSDAALAEAVEGMREHPATSEARMEAQRFATQAVDSLGMLPDSGARNALAAFAQTVADRTR
jgi:heptaprenyl diphosphate synthase